VSVDVVGLLFSPTRGSVFSNAPPPAAAAYAKKGAGSTWLFVSHEKVTYEQVLRALHLDTCVGATNLNALHVDDAQ
jgi:tRNA(Phe) wybutosine-synthesizing methylase Tyw3